MSWISGTWRPTAVSIWFGVISTPTFVAAAVPSHLPTAPPPLAVSRSLAPTSGALPEVWRAPEATVRTLFSQHADWIAVPLESLELVAVRPTPRLLHVDFRQTWEGLPILGSRIDLRFDREGRLVHLRRSAATTITPHSSRSSLARTSVDAARVSAQYALSPDAGGVEWREAEEAWWPIRATNLSLADAVSLLPAWRVAWTTDNPPGWWEAVVDAETGEILQATDRLVFESLRGSVEADIEPTTAGDTPIRVPLPHVAVSATANHTSIADTTASDGTFEIEWPAAQRVQRRAELRGRAIWIRDVADRLRTPADTLTVAVPADADVIWSSGNSTSSQRSAYYHATRAYDVIRGMDDSPALGELDRGIELRVDDPSGSCNAYWRGDYFNFFGSGGGCAALARIADVVYHEYAHAVTQFCYAPFGVPTELGEAFSDYFAASLTEQPRIGVGYRGRDTFLREIESDRVWPQDRSPDPHLEGLILAGALWDLRTAIGAAADTLFHFARYGAARTMDDFLVDLLLVDDTDGDLRNGSPHFGAIVDAFSAHGIGDYSVRLSAAPLPDLEAPDPQIEATVAIDALLGLAPDSLSLFVSTGGPFERKPLAPGDRPGDYVARFDAPPPSTVVRYYWSAADTAGHRTTLPAGAPRETFMFFVGADEIPPTITHERWEHVTEAETSLRLRARAIDNSGGIDTVFARVTVSSREFETALLRRDVADTLWEGSADVGPITVGDQVSYQLVAVDRARSPNVALLPVDGPFEAPVRRGRTLDFEADAGPLEPFGDWEWGALSPPDRAWSGERIWATKLAGAYSDDTKSTLQWGPLDLRSWDRGRLELHHAFAFEERYDGGRVEVSSDNGETWRPLAPEDGYPFQNVESFDGPGFSGASRAWSRARFPLDAHLGQVIYLRLIAASDQFVTDRGWWIDDLRMVGAQSLAPPLSFRAESGLDARVHLAWQHPPGIDRDSPRFVGYRVSRRILDSSLPFAPTHDGRLRENRWTDSAVANGVTYEYQLEVDYDEGVGPPRRASATPYAAAIVVDVERIEFELRGAAESDTTFFIRNLTPGQLRFNAFLADSGAELGDVRWLARLSNEAPSAQRWNDAVDSASPADLASLHLRRVNDPEQGVVLEFVLRGQRNWSRPMSDWGGVIFLDTDLNLATGRTSASFGWNETRNLGWEHALVFGKLARLVHPNAPAVLITSEGATRAEPLPKVELPSEADSVLLSVPWDWLGRPDGAHVAVFFAADVDSLPFDHAPNLPDAPWLQREPRSGRSLPEHPQPFSLVFDARPVGNGDHFATLFLVSNDPVRPLLEIPISLRVTGYVSDQLESLAFTSDPEALRARFRPPGALLPRFARAERSSNAGATWQTAGADTLFPDPNGNFEMIDLEAEPGVRYQFRFRVLFAAQPTRIYGPFPYEYDPELPAAWRFSASPNPFAGSTRMRLDAPRRVRASISIFDASGRAVRALFDGEARPGVRWFEWDGVNDAGRSVPTGVYWARLATPERTIIARLVRLR